MKSFQFKGYKIRLYTDPAEFARMPERPFEDFPKKFTPAHMTGFVQSNDNTIRLLVHPDCHFVQLLALVSHELGHKIEGGFKKNPPDTEKYNEEHERKANHYEDFTLMAFKLTCKIYHIINGEWMEIIRFSYPFRKLK